MKHSIEHGLDKDLARKATRKAFESYEKRFAKYNPTSEWVTEDKANVGFSAKGINVEGAIEITDDDVVLEMDVPFILKPFRKKAVGVIDDEIQEWIAKAKRGEIE
ncbi:MAG: polyhydroxyalkanoic acid system family protein [Persicimonas sp.]